MSRFSQVSFRCDEYNRVQEALQPGARLGVQRTGTFWTFSMATACVSSCTRSSLSASRDCASHMPLQCRPRKREHDAGKRTAQFRQRSGTGSACDGAEQWSCGSRRGVQRALIRSRYLLCALRFFSFILASRCSPPSSCRPLSVDRLPNRRWREGDGCVRASAAWSCSFGKFTHLGAQRQAADAAEADDKGVGHAHDAWQTPRQTS